MKPVPAILLSLLLLCKMAVAQTPLPGWSLDDVNITSARRRATAAPVTPADYRHVISAWYFGREN